MPPVPRCRRAKSCADMPGGNKAQSDIAKAALTKEALDASNTSLPDDPGDQSANMADPATGLCFAAPPLTAARGPITIDPAALQDLISNAYAAGSGAREPRHANQSALPKTPQFWTEEPQGWFRVFELHLPRPVPSQTVCFDRMLAYLPAVAISKVRSIISDPPLDAYTCAKALLLKFFLKTERARAEELREMRSLGDRSPSDMLQYMRSLQPGDAEGILFKHIWLGMLPETCRSLVSDLLTLDDMAARADEILLSAPPAVSSVTWTTSDDAAGDLDAQVAALCLHPRQQRQRSSQRRQPPSAGPASRATFVLCQNHARWGVDTRTCASPGTCPMKNVLVPAPGNAPAGR